jgi:hypothetical protein
MKRRLLTNGFSKLLANKDFLALLELAVIAESFSDKAMLFKYLTVMNAGNDKKYPENRDFLKLPLQEQTRMVAKFIFGLAYEFSISWKLTDPCAIIEAFSSSFITKAQNARIPMNLISDAWEWAIMSVTKEMQYTKKSMDKINDFGGFIIKISEDNAIQHSCIDCTRLKNCSGMADCVILDLAETIVGSGELEQVDECAIFTPDKKPTQTQDVKNLSLLVNHFTQEFGHSR